ncbi:NAD(P)-binding oxidoreductase [uncultured Paraglaciecola sp.]|uniref:NAD(P)-dependent oxidoreductase n=1 Tax=uncultured Paraglaciecola sp. TaxID=1765024 RepID=UPI0030DBFB15|tara:strand:- start:17099 stop:17824 length:726 start_codon:yes stop_codon:yes gene_type:complete
MTTLVVGASGATGRLLVEQLLANGEQVKIIVRSLAGLPDTFKQHQNLSITESNALTMTDAELLEQVQGCDAVASCLGHNLTFKGIYGTPRRLVTDTVKRLCEAIKQESALKSTAIKFVLMNTTGNQNKQDGEKISVMQKIIVALIRFIIPPHADNEQAAAYLQSTFTTQQAQIEWTAVRPDTLTNESVVSNYQVNAFPTRSAIFNAGITSRINVAHFMAKLITNQNTWNAWKNKMPVIYNQ